jgi:hypothetical protein
MVITTEDFINTRYRVNQQPEIAAWWETFIEEMEQEAAYECLGVGLWEQFLAGLDDSAGIDQKWQDLRDGKTFVYEGKTYRYNGWVDMVRPYIYSFFVKEVVQKLTNIGVIVPLTENNERVNPDYLIMKASVDWFTKAGGYGQKGNNLWTFLKAHQEDYPEWVYQVCQPMNHLTG